MAVALFGSRARGDAEEDSDVDILLITNEQHVRHAKMSSISFYLYPWEKLLFEARAGDLFTCHIIREAKILHDPNALFSALKEAFQFKQSYSSEIENAADLGWFIMHRAHELPEHLVAKRIAWCVRTVLIAKSAERREPVFSAMELAKLSRSRRVDRLIKHKANTWITRADLTFFSHFLKEQGLGDPIPGGDTHSFIARFKDRNNYVALRTMLSADISDYAT